MEQQHESHRHFFSFVQKLPFNHIDDLSKSHQDVILLTTKYATEYSVLKIN